ncbi:hypothetical protein [Mariniflexile sp.]|uniref:hypothetical protein n=1 Tax=Mariniflexile sp. TaxID=1979402 RepID=UPI003561648E
MKKIIKLSCLLFVSLAIFSCSEDDDQESFSNSITYDGSVFSVEDAYLYDFGSSEGYFVRGFSLEGTLSEDMEIEFSGIFASKGEESFTPGTFKFVNLDEEGDIENYPDMLYGEAYIFTGESELKVVAGDIVISKSGDGYSYAISGVLTLENDEVVTISYDGVFEFYGASESITKTTIKSSKIFKK